MSRYPRLIPSFVEGAPVQNTAQQPRNTTTNTSNPTTNTDNAATKVKSRLQGLVEPLRPKQLASTIEKLLDQKRYRLLPGPSKKQRPQWHSFNGLTGS